jgi:3-deoxy-D-manno-octulosonic-acid transferase
MNLFLIFYNFSLWLLALLSLPKTLYSYFILRKYRNSLSARFGAHFPYVAEKGLPSIWIHAVSMGETKAIVSLARELKQRFPSTPLIISSTTETGHAEAKRSLPFADYHVYMPLDFRRVVQKILKKAAPGLVLLCESDFWYNFLYYAKQSGAALALVNGKISEKSAFRLRWVPFFSKKLFSLFDKICVQNQTYTKRFVKIGAPSDHITITGNLKFDDDYPQLTHDETVLWRHKLGLESDEIVLTIGSTHPTEEQSLIKILKNIWKKYPKLRVILVPRHPERFKEVGLLLEKERLLWVNFTDINRRTGKEQVILIDAMGLLRMCYQLSDMAIVAGSFTDRVGGHNLLEPCWYGKPVLVGPYTFSQQELVDLMKQYKTGLQVFLDQVQEVLTRWLENPNERTEIGERGFMMVSDLKGSTARTIEVLEPLLSKFKTNEKHPLNRS